MEDCITMEFERFNTQELILNQQGQDVNTSRNFSSSFPYFGRAAGTNVAFSFSENGANRKYSVENYIEFLNKTSSFPYKLLKATIEHLFSTLSASERRTIVTSIFNLTHGSSPNFVCLTNDGSEYASKEVLLAAMESAEKRNAGISEKVLLSLINLSYAPQITNTIFEFLLFEFDGELQLISRYKQYTAVNSANRIGPPIPMHQANSRKIATFATLRRAFKERFIKTKRTGTLLVSFSIIFNIVLVSALCSVFILNSTGCNSDETANGFMVNDARNHNNDSVENETTAGKPDDKIELVIYIKSYDEYNHKFPVFSEEFTFHLGFHLDDAYDWPKNSVIFNRSMITTVQLGGRLSFDKIKDIISQMKNMTTLIIDNNDDMLCLHNKEYNLLVHDNITPPSLEKIIFRGATECMHLYDFLSSTLNLSGLKNLTMEDSVITENNVKHVQKIMKASRKDLQHITLTNTTFNTAVIDNRLGTLGAVQSLKIDMIKGKGVTVAYIPKEIHFILPNLKTFSSKYGFISVSEFRNLLKCKQLSAISTALEIPNDQNDINLYSLVGSMGKLTELNLSLKFSNSNNENQCKVLGLKQLKKRMRFQLWHNCSTDDDKYI